MDARPNETLRDRIVSAAQTLISAGGREAATTRAVASAAAVQAPTIYRLFGDKRGLMDAVAEHALAADIAENPTARPTPTRCRTWPMAGIAMSPLA